MNNSDNKLQYTWKDIEEAQKTGFNKCKDEVLRILQKHTIEHFSTHGTGHETLNIDCIDEIKKL